MKLPTDENSLIGKMVRLSFAQTVRDQLEPIIEAFGGVRFFGCEQVERRVGEGKYWKIGNEPTVSVGYKSVGLVISDDGLDAEDRMRNLRSPFYVVLFDEQLVSVPKPWAHYYFEILEESDTSSDTYPQQQPLEMDGLFNAKS